MKSFTPRLAVALMVTIMGAFAVKAQTTGSMSGTVTDPNGAVVAGATATAKNVATGAERSVISNVRGVFIIQTLQPGVYDVSIDANGFKKSVATGIEVTVNKVAELTVALEVGGGSETVTVTGAQDIINTTSPTLTNVIDTRQVASLPLPTRNPLDLAALQSGVAVIGTDTRGGSIGGLRGASTNVTQDGINAMDNYVKTSTLFALTAPSLNSTSEFSITTGTVGSEAGRGVGQVNVVTKGGTNDFHGSLFYLHRNDAFNANSYFNNLVGTPRSRQRQHFFGGDIGGPVYFLGFGENGPKLFKGKDTAFFYFSYEGFRENFSATRNRTVLTQQARQGTFRYTGTDGNLQTVNLLAVGDIGVLNPIVTAKLGNIPLPNNTLVGDGFNTGGYQYGVTGSDVNDKYVARYDHFLVKESRLGSHKLEVVYNRANFQLKPDTFNGIEAPFPGAGDAYQASARSLFTGALVSNFGSVTNVFRYGRQWAPVKFLRDSDPTAPFVVFAAGTTYDNTFMSQGRTVVVDQYKDDITMPKGDHLIRFGADYQKVWANAFNDAGINPTINLGSNSANPTGILSSELPFSTASVQSAAGGVYSTIVGLLSSASATFNVKTPTSGFVLGATRQRLLRQKDLGLYVQDQWRAKKNLTLSLGVRWELIGVPTVPDGVSIAPTDPVKAIWGVSGVGNIFKPTAAAGAAPAVGVLDFIDGTTGRAMFNKDLNNFAPFFGLAWAPEFKGGILKALFGEVGKSSVRIGYSVSYTRDGFTTFSNALGTGTTNAGLIQSGVNTTPTGVLTSAGVALPTPTFTMPITDRANNLINPNNGIWGIDPNLRTPYVQQWNIGFEREIFKDTAIEVRYAGNRASKIWRAYDINEINIFENGFLQEFLNAKANLAARGGANFAGSTTPGAAACATCVPTPILDKFFAGFSATSTSGYGSSSFINALTFGNVGTMANTLAWSNTYRANRENTANGIAANFFVANPNALFSRLLMNASSSDYNSLQVDLRRRFANGLQFQAAYTFSKVLTDTPGSGASQSDLESYWTLRNKGFDKQRAGYDQRHRIVTNVIYQLPFGKSKKWLSGSTILDKLVGGWTIGGIGTYSTRPPFYVSSGRATFNQFGGFAQLSGISFEDFKKVFGVFKTPSGVYFVNPDYLNITTNATTGRYVSSTLKPGYLSAPTAGNWGNFPRDGIDGPSYYNVDLSITKQVTVGERLKFELKTTMINVLNHSNFSYGTVSFDSTSFGRISSQSGSPRIIHFTGTMRF